MSDSFFAIPLNDDDLAAPPPPRRKTITRSGSADNLMLHFSSMGVDLSGGPLSAALDLLEEDNSEQQRPRVSLHKTSSSPFLVQPVGSSLKEAGLMSVWTSSSGTSAADNNSEGDTNLIIDCHPSSSSLSRTTTNRSSAPSEGERTSSTSTGMDEDSTGSMTEILLDKIKLDAFRQWIVAFCTVDFDLEFGQGSFFNDFHKHIRLRIQQKLPVALYSIP